MKNFNYFYTGLGLPKSQFAIYYDFNESGVNPILPQPSSQTPFSGLISSLDNFYSVSGSGYFTGQNIAISNASGLNSNTFSMFFVYEKPQSGNGILFSSLSSGSGGGFTSGFILGINDANRLYFESRDQSGPNIYTSSNIYAEKNAIAVVKSNSSLSFNYFNFNYQSIESEFFNISSTARYGSNNVYLGSPVGAPSYISQNSFSGYLDQFVYINNALTSSIVQNLFSGFYANKNPDTVQIIGYTNSFVTGATMIPQVVGTGITGFNTYLSGYIFDNCGDSLPIYSYNNVTGTIIEDAFIPIGGQVSYSVSGIVDNGFNIDANYCNTFGMNGITYLKNSNNLSELYTYSQIGVTDTNLLAQYNLDSTFKLNQIYNSGQVEVFYNGLSYYPDGFYLSGNGYVNNLYLSGNYFLSGQSIISTGLFSSTGTLSYNVVSGNWERFFVSGSGSYSLPSSNINNRIVFLNGQKLVSGTNYNFTLGNLNIINAYSSGVITNLPVFSGFSYMTGNFQSILINKFSRDSSELWLSGLKQTLNQDYLEISNVDLLKGSGIFSSFPNILYNNDQLFLETF